MSIIELVEHPYPLDIFRSRTDYARVSGSELVERPYWFKNIETGQLYYDLYSTIGWPSEVTDSSDGMPGYAAVVGVVRPTEDLDTNDPTGANFQLLAEVESKDVPLLLGKCLELRKQYGFGVQKNLLTVWLGDPDRFCTTLALLNEVLVKDGEANAILVSPPDDWWTPKIFDNYVRALRSTLLKETRRFYFGHNDMLQNRLREFHRDDPCVMAVGGLVHSMLCRTTWMDSVQESVFAVEDENEL